MTVAVLAVQGAFAEHKTMLEKIGVSCVELRQKSDAAKHYDGLILPGGESTVQGKLLKELELLEPLRSQIRDGLPVFATCAGLILLAQKLSNDTARYFQTLPVTVRRNAYGRQVGSFYTEQNVKGTGVVPMTFIRAPYIENASEEVEILAVVENHIVAVKYKNQIALSFHPELTGDTRLHAQFIKLIRSGGTECTRELLPA